MKTNVIAEMKKKCEKKIAAISENRGKKKR